MRYPTIKQHYVCMTCDLKMTIWLGSSTHAVLDPVYPMCARTETELKHERLRKGRDDE